jgi:ethanolamine utilization cobalamin adenosyltransferase
MMEVLFSMGVLTEAVLRILLKDADLDAMDEYCVESGVIVTPAARSWLLENKIDLVIGGKRVTRAAAPQKSPDTPSELDALSAKKSVPRILPDGADADGKPEHMTCLHGSTLVCKSHGLIRLRGKLDSLAARIIEVQLAFQRLGLLKGIDDLEETLAFVRGIIRAEYREKPLAPISLFGMDEAELRKRSHRPDEFYGTPHFFASIHDGEAVVLLNSLRTASREVELEACRAYNAEVCETKRPDIIFALNRLSSAYYVMMFRAKTKEYES